MVSAGFFSGGASAAFFSSDVKTVLVVTATVFSCAIELIVANRNDPVAKNFRNIVLDFKC